MANTQKTNASPKAVQDASKTWDDFITVTKICGVVIVITLLIMAVTLV